MYPYGLEQDNTNSILAMIDLPSRFGQAVGLASVLLSTLH